MKAKLLLTSMFLCSVATVVSAENMFGTISEMDPGTYIDVNIPNVTQDGYVAAYALYGPNAGELIGYRLLEMGVAADERIRFGGHEVQDVMVYLFHGEPFQPISAAVDQVRVSIDND